MTLDWPDARLDAVAKLYVLAAGIPGSVITDAWISAEPDQVWASMSDLEWFVPAMQPQVRRLTVVGIAGDHLLVELFGCGGARAQMTADVRPRLCCMQSRRLVSCMAVAPAAGGARFARLQAVRVPVAAQIALRPAITRSVERETWRVAQQFES